ncbi:MAG: DUF3501 family protein, partial [Burkholderiales bacterium]
VRYQIQEMLRIEKIFEEEGIQHELASYDPLIPDGRNFKATMLIEYAEPEVRRAALGRLKGIEQKVWIQVEGSARVYPIADEDLERENDEKTSAVHFLRWELTEEMAAALKYGVTLSMGIDHANYSATVSPLATDIRGALVADLS